MLKRDGMHIRRIVLRGDSDIAGSVPRAAKIIACLSRDINTVSEIASQCKLAKSTVHRVLKLLEASYLVTEDPIERKYYVGPLLSQLTINPRRVHEYLIKCAEKEINHLANISEETISLDILLGIQEIPLYEVYSIHELGFTDQNRRIGPLFTGASFKVLISQFSDERIKMSLKHLNIPKVTSNTVTDKETVLAQIFEVRSKGYAVSYGERFPGVICISAPVVNYTSPASISIVGPELRLKPKLDSLINELKSSCFKVSKNVLDIYAVKKIKLNSLD